MRDKQTAEPIDVLGAPNFVAMTLFADVRCNTFDSHLMMNYIKLRYRAHPDKFTVLWSIHDVVGIKVQIKKENTKRLLNVD